MGRWHFISLWRSWLMDGRKVGLFLLVKDQVTNLKYIITSGMEKQPHQNWIKDIIKCCIYEDTCTVAALLSLDLHVSLDLEMCPWHLKFSSVFLYTFPAGFIFCCACIPHMKCTSFSLPAGFACRRLLLHWKTRRFKDFALLGCLTGPLTIEGRSLKISQLRPCTRQAALFSQWHTGRGIFLRIVIRYSNSRQCSCN